MRLCRSVVTVLYVCFAVAAAMSAAASPVKFEVTGVGTPTPVSLSLRPVRTASDVDRPAEVTAVVTAPGAVTVDLPAGNWSLDASGPAIWHASQYFTVARTNATVRVQVWPAGTIAARVGIKGRREPPSVVTVRFQPHENRDRLPAAETTCAVVAGRIRCPMPAGDYDIRLRPAGCITRFLWNTRIDVAAARDLGTIVFVPGASIVGRIEIGAGVAAGKIAVTATPANIAANPDIKAAGGIRLAALPAVVEPKGVFHIDGLPPGRYTLTASADAHQRARAVDVDVVENVTAELREPLRIEVPKVLRLAITPLTPGDGERWHVALTREVTARRTETVTQSSASADGAWSSPPLNSGRYDISVGRDDDSTWHAETIDFGDRDLLLPIHVEQRQVRGRVRMAGKPLQARVELRSGRASATFETDSDGAFRGDLPWSSGAWTADVKASASPVHIILTDVAMRPAEDGVTIAIELPNTGIIGTVVDESNRPVADALVNIAATDERAFILQQTTDAAGAFTLAGLAPGTYQVHAGSFVRESTPVQVTVRDDDAPEPLTLVVHDVTKVHGRVYSPFGPVAGAEVIIAPTDVEASFARINVTDAGGEFATTVAPGAREVNVFVAAPGFAYKLFHTRLRDSSLDVPVDQRGGRIELPAAQGELAPALVHAGAVQWAANVSDAASAGGRITLPAIESGPYGVCMVTPDEYVSLTRGIAPAATRCRTGFVPPHGTLTFDFGQ